MHYTPISNGIIPVRNGTNNDINKLDYGPVLYLYIHPVDLGLWPALVSLFSFLFFVVSFFFSCPAMQLASLFSSQLGV